LHLHPPAHSTFHLLILLEKFSYDLHRQWSSKCRKCKALVLRWVAYKHSQQCYVQSILLHFSDYGQHSW
jgi:hypothetical protein